jgi:hypothetical protein
VEIIVWPLHGLKKGLLNGVVVLVVTAAADGRTANTAIATDSSTILVIEMGFMDTSLFSVFSCVVEEELRNAASGQRRAIAPERRPAVG